MSEKRYFKIEYDEEWYLFDSTTISEQLVKEQAEYGYGVFANSLSPSEVVDLLNYQDRLIEEQHDEIINWTKKYVRIKKENDQLKQKFKNNEYYRNRINDLEMMLRLREDELQVRQKIIAEAEDKRLKRS